jgi:hypothetical protein
VNKTCRVGKNQKHRSRPSHAKLWVGSRVPTPVNTSCLSLTQRYTEGINIFTAGRPSQKHPGLLKIKTAAKALQASSITANSSSIVDTPGSPGEFSSNFGIEACTCRVCQGQHSTDLTIKCPRPRSALLGT